MSRVLIADDEAAICWALRALVEAAGHEAVVAATGRRALELAREAPPDAVFLDVRLPDADGLDVLDQLRAERPGAGVIVITGHGGLDVAVRAMQAGAADYLVKPLDVEGARAALARALEASGRAPRPASAAPATTELLIGRTPAMQEVYKRIGAVAGSDVPVLIQGESGTGKELVARALHAASPRRAGPFEPIDCAALPAELIESELFGHDRGAFTGAVGAREGRIRRADGGTVFFDEVGELPMAAQAKLLRFLAERELVPLGGGARVRVDVRVVAATHRPLAEAVRRGEFREDLYYRLNIFAIALPSLRERRADIPLLVERFLGPTIAISDEALTALREHDWPGNVRELRNAIDHARVVARGGVIRPEHLPALGPPRREAGATALKTLAATLLDEATAAGVLPSRYASEQVERALLVEGLGRTGGSIAGTARLLGLTRVTVRKRLRELGLGDDDKPDAG